MIVEKDVENFYRTELLKVFKNASFTSPFGTDGVLEAKEQGRTLKVLTEFKYNHNFSSKSSRNEVVLQALYYLKKFESKGHKLPHLVLIGDKDEAFVLHTNHLLRYLSKDLDWSVSPSVASKHPSNIAVLSELDHDEFLDVYVFHREHEKNFFNEIKTKLMELDSGNVRKIRITSMNIENIYNYFVEYISFKPELSTNESVNLFVNVLINSEGYYLHPKKANTLVTPSKDLKVDAAKFKSFFSRFDLQSYSLVEKKHISGCLDRLLEDSVRRKKGEFYTPKIWVDKAHEYIASAFGEDWRDKYVVWDNSCGVGNLTKDYKFANLIQTTLEQSDIETITHSGYNKGSTKLAFDFLNDDIPQTIIHQIQGKELIVFMNPPYKTAGNGKRDGEADTGVAETKVRSQMIAEKWQGYGQLYVQFIYRCLQFEKLYGCKVHLALFAPPLYLSSSSFQGFRDKMFQQVGFHSGFLFRASEFSGTAANWAVAFSIFKSNQN